MRVVLVTGALALAVTGGCGGGGDGDLAAYCARLTEARHFDAATAAAPGDGAAAARREEFVDLLRAAEEVAPGAIRADVGTVADFSAALAAVDTDAAVEDDPFAAAGGLDRAAAGVGDVHAATARLVAHARLTCRVDLGGPN